MDIEPNPRMEWDPLKPEDNDRKAVDIDSKKLAEILAEIEKEN